MRFFDRLLHDIEIAFWFAFGFAAGILLHDHALIMYGKVVQYLSQ